MPDEPKKVSCPNCAGIASMEGNKIICETCDATYTITKTGGARVKEIGRLDSIEDRLKRVEGLFTHEPDPKKLEPDPAAAEDSILGPE